MTLWFTILTHHISTYKLYQVCSVMKSKPLKDNDIPTVLPGWRFIKPNFVVCLKWIRPGTIVLGRTIGRVCVDERAVWTAFLCRHCEACKRLVYQSDTSYKYISHTFKPINDSHRIPDVTLKLGDVNNDLQIPTSSSASDWRIWPRRHFCPTIEQLGGYQKHTVIGLVLKWTLGD